MQKMDLNKSKKRPTDYYLYLLLGIFSCIIMGCDGSSELIINNNGDTKIEVFYCRIEAIDTLYYGFLKKVNASDINLNELVQVVNNPSTDKQYKLDLDSREGCANLSIPPHSKARLVYSRRKNIFNSDGISEAIGVLIIKDNGKIIFSAHRSKVKELFNQKAHFGRLTYQLDILKQIE